MTLTPSDLRELQAAIADNLYIQIASWHLYLGDAGLAEELAIECSAKLDQGGGAAAKQALDAVEVKLAGGSTRLPLARLVPPSQLYDLEEILTTYCR